MAFNCYAEEIRVNSLGQGSCWYQGKGRLNLSSFNDNSASSMTYGEISAALKAFVLVENPLIQTLHLHCGAYGFSLVTRIKSDSGNLCLWATIINGKWKMRSLGGISEQQKNDSKLCDGFKQGELLVALKNRDYLDQIRGEKWSSVIKEITPVAFDIYKIKLMEEYFSREEEVARMFQENFGISVEFNQYQHGVGEYVQLQ
jgi:hypothetical protein